MKLLFALLCVIPSITHASTYYVSPGGSDANAGTLEKPFRTVDYAAEKLQAGDVLILRGGTYRENANINCKPGALDKPIVLQPYVGETPVIQGLFWLRRPTYWIIDGISVTWHSSNNSRQHMVKVTGGVGWVIKNCHFWGAKSYANLYLTYYSSWPNEPSRFIIAHNRIHDTYPSNSTNQDHGIYCNPGLHDSQGIIERNLIYNATNGEGVKLGGSSTSSGGANGVTVRYNTIHNTRMAVICYGQTGGNLITRNLLVKTHPNYGAVRGYKLSRTGNIAKDNAVWATKKAVDNYDGGKGVTDGGGNVFLNPQFSGDYQYDPARVPYGHRG